MIAENLQNIRSRIHSVCHRVGRNPEEVGLIAVSKSVDAARIIDAYNAGQKDFGENYVQDLRKKQEIITVSDLHWHFIGHLQSNKVRMLVGSITLIHSVDSLHLAQEIDRQAERSGRSVEILIEVHTTDESTKSGVPPGDVVGLIEKISPLQHIRVMGLMTVGPFLPDPETARPCFQTLKRLRDEIEERRFPGVCMRHLSMGMSGDFEVAIEEGATLLRIGTAIFGPRQHA